MPNKKPKRTSLDALGLNAELETVPAQPVAHERLSSVRLSSDVRAGSAQESAEGGLDWQSGRDRQPRGKQQSAPSSPSRVKAESANSAPESAGESAQSHLVGGSPSKAARRIASNFVGGEEPADPNKVSSMSAPPASAGKLTGWEDSAEKRKIVKTSVYLPEPVFEELRQLAFVERKKMHDFLLEGIDRVFADRGIRSIAELLARTEQP